MVAEETKYHLVQEKLSEWFKTETDWVVLRRSFYTVECVRKYHLVQEKHSHTLFIVWTLVFTTPFVSLVTL